MSAELRALAEKATPGPWERYDGGPDDRFIAEVGGPHVARIEVDTDAAYIAAASPDVILRLLDERDAAIRRAEELEAALRDAVDVVDRATSENNDSIPLYDFLAEDAARLIDAARAALRSQESQTGWREASMRLHASGDDEPYATDEPCDIEPAFSQHEYAVDYCETHDQPADLCRSQGSQKPPETPTCNHFPGQTECDWCRPSEPPEARFAGHRYRPSFIEYGMDHSDDPSEPPETRYCVHGERDTSECPECGLGFVSEPPETEDR